MKSYFNVGKKWNFILIICAGGLFYIEKEDPQPQVVDALGLRITN